MGRAIEAGFASPSRTTIITSTHRLYSIHEKMPAGDAIYPREWLEEAARTFSRRFVGFDALALARANRSEANAVLLGALAATEVLPVGVESFRKAIEKKGVEVAANLKGFEAGYELVRRGADRPAPAVSVAKASVRFARARASASKPTNRRENVRAASSSHSRG